MEHWYVGRITPVVHYSMGGLHINKRAQVLLKSGAPIAGLYAAGEIVGGIHGKARLGGNALTECVVFGRAAGLDMNIATQSQHSTLTPQAAAPQPNSPKARTMTMAQVRQETASHLVVLFGKVYDFSSFVEEHPGGPESILRISGKDGTAEFLEVHTEGMLEDFEPIASLVG